MNLKEIRREAQDSLKGNWGLAIGGWITVSLINWVISLFVVPRLVPPVGFLGGFIFGFIIGILTTAVLTAGLTWLFLGFVDRKNERFGTIFSPFSNYGRVVGAVGIRQGIVMLWSFIPGFIIGFFTSALNLQFRSTTTEIIFWLLVMIIPAIFAIIANIRYSQVQFLVKDYPELAPIAAIQESKALMNNRMGKYFLQQVFFQLWLLPGYVLLIMAISPLFRVIVDVINLIERNPFVSQWIIEGMIEDALLANGGRGAVILFFGLILGGLYLLGISFWISPYHHAANAVFYRQISGNVSELTKQLNPDAQPVVEKFVFANNTPPRETVEEKLTNERLVAEAKLREKIISVMTSAGATIPAAIPILWRDDVAKTVITCPETGEDKVIPVYEIEKYFPTTKTEDMI